MKKLRKLWHRIEHRMGWNTGRVEVWWADGELMVGFACDGCRKIEGVQASPNFVPEHLR